MTDVARLPVRVGCSVLTPEQVALVARSGAPVKVTPKVRRQVRASHEALLSCGRPLYGVTTGVGALDAARVDEGRAEEGAAPPAPRAPMALLRSHAAGAGDPLPDDEVRALMVVRLEHLAKGRSGVSLDLVLQLAAALNRGLVPEVPAWGSVGASDLCPLAHVGLVLAGEGRARIHSERLPAAEALARAGLRPHRFTGREALALMNGLGRTVGAGALALVDAGRWLDAAEAALALGMHALLTPATTLEERTLAAKVHRRVAEVGARLAAILRPADERAATTTLDEGPAGVLREPLSTRSAPHVIGAARDAWDYARAVLVDELAACVDNPLVDPDGWVTSNAGNGDGTRVGLALDHLADALTVLAAQSERRTARLLDASHSRGLPAFLQHPESRPGVDSGLMIAQYGAASLVAELAGRRGPAAASSTPVSAGTEDWCPMSAVSAGRALRSAHLFARVVSFELLCAAQAVDLRERARPPLLDELHAALRSVVPVLVEDRVVADDAEAVRRLVDEGGLGPALFAAARDARSAERQPSARARKSRTSEAEGSLTPRPGRRSAQRSSRRS